MALEYRFHQSIAFKVTSPIAAKFSLTSLNKLVPPVWINSAPPGEGGPMEEGKMITKILHPDTHIRQSSPYVMIPIMQP